MQLIQMEASRLWAARANAALARQLHSFDSFQHDSAAAQQIDEEGANPPPRSRQQEPGEFISSELSEELLTRPHESYMYPMELK